MNNAFHGAENLQLMAADAPDLSDVTNLGLMFYQARMLNSPLNHWDVSGITNMNSMLGRTSFNQPLNNWDVSSVTDMTGMFTGNAAFNQPLNNWDVSNVTNMSAMFAGAASFNQPINNWDVSNITNMSMMFLSEDIVSSGYFDDLLPNGLSVDYYDAAISAWSELYLQNAVTFDADTSQYCDSLVKRDAIITTYNWTINDSGKNCQTINPKDGAGKGSDEVLSSADSRGERIGSLASTGMNIDTLFISALFLVVLNVFCVTYRLINLMNNI